MKATLKFTLPEEQIEHKFALQGQDWYLVAWRMSEFLHRCGKDDIPVSAKQIEDHLHDTIDGLGLSLDD